MPHCELPACVGLGGPLTAFANAAGTDTQAQVHIKLLHQHIAVRLVLEGGFLPDEIRPHPPLYTRKQGSRYVLEFDAERSTSSEQTIIGGLKSKNVDVVVTKEGLGPVVAISVKGTTGAFRNLTNRMEEAIGDCTNVHIMYPGLVYGFMAVVRANRATQRGIKPNDICIQRDGSVAQSIVRYHDILSGLAGRRFVRDEPTRYEAVALVLVEPRGAAAGTVLPDFPSADSPLHFPHFFPAIYEAYDLRYPYMASQMKLAERVEWDEDSPALVRMGDVLGSAIGHALGYTPRLA